MNVDEQVKFAPVVNQVKTQVNAQAAARFH